MLPPTPSPTTLDSPWAAVANDVSAVAILLVATQRKSLLFVNQVGSAEVPLLLVDPQVSIAHVVSGSDSMLRVFDVNIVHEILHSLIRVRYSPQGMQILPHAVS